MNIKVNVGTTEQKVRIAVGALLLIVGLAANLPAGMNILALVVGVVAVVTGAIRFCPAWSLFGINTSELSRKSE
jgi:uncharacterized membrane protein HdeD (DUF308 family)